MKNLLKVLAMISGLVGVILLILGIIAIFNCRTFLGHLWGNYFYAAQTILIAGIFLLFASRECSIGKKE